MKKLLVIVVWLPTTFVTLLLTIKLYSSSYYESPAVPSQQAQSLSLEQMPYQLYSSLPSVLGAAAVNSYAIESADAIPELVADYMAKHNSPMLETSNDLVLAARKYDLDPLLLVAIAQCESNLGKKMPENCNNPFGWGIHSRGTLCFNSWQEGYQTVAKGLRDKYFNKGMDNPDDMMAVYTPPALEKNGSWAKCVNHFLGQLNEIKDQE